MEKRLPLALVLSLLFLWGYMMWVAKSAPPAAGAPTGAVSEAQPSGAVPASSAAADPGAVDDAAARAADADVPVSTAPARTLLLDGDDTRSEWTSQGASLAALWLSEYRPSPDSDEPLALLGEVEPGGRNFLLRDVTGSYHLDELHWHVLEEPGSDGRGGARFQLDTADGLRFTRSVANTDEPFTLALTIEVSNQGTERSPNLSLALESARGVIDEEAGSLVYGAPTALVVVARSANDPEVVSWKAEDLVDGQPRSIGDTERVLAVGSMTNYFTSLLVPEEGTDVRQVFPRAVVDGPKLQRAVEAQQPRDQQEAERLARQLAPDFRTNASAELALLVRRLEPGETQAFGFRAYSGPKALEVAGRPGFAFLKPVIEASYGSWGWINRTLLQVLRFLHAVVGNWGVAIILLTILVRGLLFPLNRRQQTSMSRYSAVMQKLKPQLDELKAKYKNNIRKYNEEQMKLLRAEGASPPLGGCLLMFLQFPVWISLFQILGTSIELRQSRFVGWIDDLSRPDAMPFGLFGLESVNLLPLFMAAATMAQMRFQPKPADEAQAQMQKVMGLLMPVMMLFFLYRYSAGLSLYICTSSLLGIFEYQVIRRIWPVAGTPGSGGKPGSGKAGGDGGGKGPGRKQGAAGRRKDSGDTELLRV